MAKTLFLLNDPPYGTERSYNALRLAGALAGRDGEQVKLFLIGDAAACAASGQKVPAGYYNVEQMLRKVGAAWRRDWRLLELHGRARSARRASRRRVSPQFAEPVD